MDSGFNRFAHYFIAFMEQVWEQFKDFWVSLYEILANILFRNHVSNFQLIGDYSEKFNVVSWILFVLIDGIVLVFLVLFVIKIFQLCRRWFKFRKKEVDKEDLLFEIANLKREIKKLTKEKEKILGMKFGEEALDEFGPSLVSDSSLFGANAELGFNANGTLEGKDGKDSKVLKEGESRFSKLIDVDNKYKDGNYIVSMSKDDMIGLPEIVSRFVNYSASQHRLYYTEKTISKFISGFATSKIIILEGISGTGKTSLPYAFSRFMGNQAQIVSVQPSWRDRTEILGYLNEFTKRFNETDFLKALYENSFREDPNIIVLDEMNLARIEYYFAEFLSIMEMPDKSEWKIDLVPTQNAKDPKHLLDGKLLIPQNTWYVGTANRDDSTYTITDKVYDRAITLYLNERAKYFDAPFTESLNISYDYLERLFTEARDQYPISLKNLQNIDKLDVFVQENFKIAFGNRILRQMKMFTPVYVACGNTELEALDYLICTKIFKKFEALNLPFLRNELLGLLSLLDKLFGKGTFKECIAYINDLLKYSA